MNIILYHANCNDGFGSAWAHHQITNSQAYRAMYFAMFYDESIPFDLTPKDTIYMLDYSMSRMAVTNLCAKVRKVIIIDHHKSAIEDLHGLDKECSNLELVFSSDKSGCVLTWEYFTIEPVPLMLELIQDRDLWLFKNPASKPFNLALNTVPKVFTDWNNIYYNGLEVAMAQEGMSMQKNTDAIIKSIVDACSGLDIEGNRAAIVCCPPILASDTCHAMLTAFSICSLAIAYHIESTYVKYSIRGDGSIDCALLANRMGSGGGHHNAAGFTLPIELSHLVTGRLL